MQEVQLELEREKKWLKMLRQWDAVSSLRNDKIKRRIYKGVPNSVRGRLWSRMLRLDTVREEQQGKYQVNELILFSYTITRLLFS